MKAALAVSAAGVIAVLVAGVSRRPRLAFPLTLLMGGLLASVGSTAPFSTFASLVAVPGVKVESLRPYAGPIAALAALTILVNALNLLAMNPLRRDDWILTPHPGELGRLLQLSVAEVEAERHAMLERAVTLTVLSDFVLACAINSVRS